ncbi:multiprotein-bridging factor 1 family protein [Nanoarchaeota archaeon]
MEECFKCGIQISKSRLFDAVSKEGIVKICKNCSKEENIPIIRRSIDFESQEPEQRQTVYQRLSKSSGLTSDHNPGFVEKKQSDIDKLANENILNSVKSEIPEDLIENFHWIIMRKRRMIKLTQEQFAEKIREPIAVVQMLEKATLPRDYKKIIKKIEDFLNIRLLKQEPAPEFVDAPNIHELSTKIEQEGITPDSELARELTVSELKNMNPQTKVPYWRRAMNKMTGKKSDSSETQETVQEQSETKTKTKPSQSDDISQDKINDIIFGRKS